MTIETKADLKLAVLHQLHTGKANALTGKDLAGRLGERDTRQIRLAIQELIVDGVPVIGSAKPPYGYYIAETFDECKENLDLLMAYIKMTARHHKFLLRAAGKFKPQLKLGLKV